MLRHFLIVTFRNIFRNLASSVINIVSLGIGLTVALLIVFFVTDELSYNRFHDNFKDIYRVTSDVNFGGRKVKFGSVSAPMGPTFLEELPEITASSRIVNQPLAIQTNEELISEQVLYVDPGFYEIFSFTAIEGEPSDLFKLPNQIVINERMAQKYLPDQDAVGKVISASINGNIQLLTVCAVMNNVPDNSSVQFNVLLPFKKYADLNPQRVQTWGDFSITTFFLTLQGADIEELTDNANEILKRHIDFEYEIGFQALGDFHLNTEIIGNNGMKKSSDPWYSYILLLIATFVLLMACVNYTNISLAYALPRATEIGVRKSYGASQRSLISQFLGESVVLGFCALLMAVLLISLALPSFRDLTGKSLTIWQMSNLPVVFAGIGLVLFISLLAGAYPAFVISSADPVVSLRGRIQLGGKKLLSQVLVVLQFAIASFFVIITSIVSSQTSYIDDVDLGYDSQGIIGLPIYLSPDDRLLEKFRFELQGKSEVKMITADLGGLSKTTFTYDNQRFQTFQNRVDYDFIETFDMTLLQGRNFSPDFVTDKSESLIVNETFLESTGITGNPIGIRISARAGFSGGTIIGVMKDHHFQSLKEKIEPIVFHMQEQSGSFGMLWLKLVAENSESIKVVSEAWNKLLPTVPFSYSYHQDETSRAYKEEFQLKKLVNYTSVFALIISSLGLFGLSSLLTQQRVKELGIRKILGASVPSLIQKISGKFLSLIILAIVISSPLAYYFGARWLENFAYHTEIRMNIFILTAVYLLTLSFITIGLQSLKAVRTNPVNLIRERN